MRLDRCKNGHMYDKDRYGDICPYCKSEGLKPEIREKKVNLVEEMDDDDRTTAYWAKDSKVDPVSRMVGLYCRIRKRKRL